MLTIPPLWLLLLGQLAPTGVETPSFTALVRPTRLSCPGLQADPTEAVPGAEVTVTCANERVRATTDATGRARLVKPATSDCALTVTAPGYLPWVGAANEASQDVQLARPATVVFSVVDGAGRPLDGSEVSLSVPAESKAFIARLAPGVRVAQEDAQEPSDELTLRVPSAGLTVTGFPAGFRHFSRSGLPGKHRWVCPGPAAHVTFVVDTSVTLEAHVTFDGTSASRPLAKVLVRYDDGDTFSLAETETGFVSDELHPGDATVIVQGMNAHQACTRVHFDQGQRASVELTLTPTSSCAPPPQ